MGDGRDVDVAVGVAGVTVAVACGGVPVGDGNGIRLDTVGAGVCRGTSGVYVFLAAGGVGEGVAHATRNVTQRDTRAVLALRASIKTICPRASWG